MRASMKSSKKKRQESNKAIMSHLLKFKSLMDKRMRKALLKNAQIRDQILTTLENARNGRLLIPELEPSVKE
jgi:hypothetical protein